MGRQVNDPTIVNSSIALLQERFRQLEKVKERKEGKELLGLLPSESQRSTSSSSMQHNPLVVPHRPTTHHIDSLSLGLNLTSKKDDQNTMKSSTSSSSLWPQGASTSRNFDTSDVDTSLHL